MGKGTVEAPDPHAIAQADAYYNRIDQYTPFGSLQFRGPGRNQAVLQLSPDQQRLLDTRETSDQALLDMALGRQEGFGESLPDLVSGLQGLEDFDRARFEDAIFDRGSGLLNRQFDRQEDLLRQDLANRGLMSFDPELGEAAQTELGLFNEARDEAFQNLALDAVTRGGAEQRADIQSQVAQQLTDANLIETNRARQFNELAALLGLQQTAAPGLQSFFGPAQADVTGGFALQNQANIANAQNQSNLLGGLLGGLFDLGAAGIGRS